MNNKKGTLSPHYQELIISTLKGINGFKKKTFQFSEVLSTIYTTAGILGLCVAVHLISAATHNLHLYFDLTHTRALNPAFHNK